MKLSKSLLDNNQIVNLHNLEWLEKQRVAGKLAATCLSMLENIVKNYNNQTMLQLSRLIEEFILDNKSIATFKNYKSFPEAVCISINNQLVHGIPTDYILKDNDLVSFDLGVTYESAIADTAITCCLNNSHKLIDATRIALDKAIESIAIGKRVGVIGNAISKYAKKEGYEVVVEYGGHGVGRDPFPHESPFISNKDNPDNGIRIQEGLTIAIEPLLAIDNKTFVDSDGWTVCTNNLSAHFEHTVYVHRDRVEVITSRDS